MSFNIVDLIKDQISDQVLGQLSGVLGADTANTSGALAGAVPGLLGGLTNAASNPSGASALFNAVQDQDDGLLGNIGNLLGGDQASSLGSNGTSLLTSLLGDGALGQLAGVIASVAGVNRGNSSSLIGMLAPLIIGVLKKTVLDGGLNAGSLSSMLSNQSDNVSAAMPQGFSSQLQSAGFFDSIAPDALSALSSPAAAVASTATTAAPVAATQAAVSTANESSSGGGFMKWILPLVAIAGIAWFGMQYMNKQAASDAAAAAQVAAEKAEATAQAAADKAEAVKAQAKEAADSAAAALTAAQESMPAGVDLGKISGGLDGVFGSASEALTGITDLESAKNAIPSLTEAAGNLGGINDVIARLPDAAKGPLASIVQGGIGTLQPLIDKISAIPGVGAIIEPVVAPIMEMLNGMAG